METQYSRQSILHSIAWIFSSNVFNAAMSFAASIFVVRFMSIQDYGDVQFALSVFAFIQVFEMLSHMSIIKKKILQNPDRSFDYIRSGSQIVWVFSGLFCLISFTTYTSTGEHLYLYLLLLSIGLFFKGLNNNIYAYFEAHLRLRESQLPQSISYLISNGLKVVMAALNPVVIWQILCVLFFNFINGILTLKNYEFAKARRSWLEYDKDLVKEICKESLPLFLSSLATLVLYRIDVVMLGIMSTKENVSYYSNAVKLSEPWALVATALISTYFPVILVTKKKSLKVYYFKIRNLFSVLFFISVMIAVFGTILSSELVVLAFGLKYMPVIPILQVHIWSNVFLFWISAQHIWDVSEDMTFFALVRSVMAAVLNIILNFILIPRIGVMACPISSVITYFCAAIGFNLLHPKTRFLLKQQLISIIEVPAALKNLRYQLKG